MKRQEDFDKKNMEEALGECLPRLFLWYRENRRILPWREDPTPYHVWVSEIMLQQTRVEAVKRYYDRFLAALPDIASLAACPDDTLMKLWEGLGYYRRVRNMQLAAQEICAKYDGRFPEAPEEIRALPGIGDYTAGAIASIAFAKPYAAVDGNVCRIFARFAADPRDIGKDSTKREYARVITSLFTSDLFADLSAGYSEDFPADFPQDGKNPNPYGTFAQALMDLGATVCLPNTAPLCESCPLFDACRSAHGANPFDYPVKRDAKPRKIEHLDVLLLTDGEHVVIQKRPAKGLLAGLYEFPNVEHVDKNEDKLLCIARVYSLEPLQIKQLGNTRHIFTHKEWSMTGYLIRVAEPEWSDGKQPVQKIPGTDALFVKRGALENQYAIPSAFSYFSEIIRTKLDL